MQFAKLLQTRHNPRRWALIFSAKKAWKSPMGLLQNIAANMRRLMAERGMSGAALADKIGVDHTVVSRWLNCKASPRLQNIEKMAKVFGVPVETLTQQPEAPTLSFDSDEIDELLALLRKQGRDVETLFKKLSDRPTKKNK
jgi:transcriptional regulator with XRE-family HTH domain